jgi:16S rRNA (cytidine1402-2'-O)-methyltransferase
MTQPGTLYIVATPLGNLEDLTFRAARVLGEVDLVAAEDTRRTRVLLASRGLHPPLRALHGDSSAGEISALVAQLRAGKSLAYVSEAGTPGVSDPGAALVAAARAAGLTVVPIPGAAAAAVAFSVAGFSTAGFLLAGFVPRRKSDRRAFLARWTAQDLPVVLFESPQRILATLADLAELIPERTVVIARELTKAFEQIVAVPAARAAEALSPEQVRGEFTLVIEGARQAPEAPAAASETDLAAAIALLQEAGTPRKTVAQVLQLLTPLSRNEAYKRAGGVRDES